MKSKNLHKHAAPITVIALGLFVFSTVVILKNSNQIGLLSSLSLKSLTTSYVDIAPNKYGLINIKFTVADKTQPLPAQVIKNSEPVLNTAQDLSSNTQLSIGLTQLTNNIVNIKP